MLLKSNGNMILPNSKIFTIVIWIKNMTKICFICKHTMEDFDLFTQCGLVVGSLPEETYTTKF